MDNIGVIMNHSPERIQITGFIKESSGAIHIFLNRKVILEHSLLRLLQLAVQPAVLLLLDEQTNDVSMVKAEERVVVA